MALAASCRACRWAAAAWAWGPESGLRPGPIGSQIAEQGPGPRERSLLDHLTHKSNAGHTGAFRVVAAGQVGRKSPGPFWPDHKGRSRDPHEARQPDSLTQ
jgi:hypothetical protein